MATTQTAVSVSPLTFSTPSRIVPVSPIAAPQIMASNSLTGSTAINAGSLPQGAPLTYNLPTTYAPASPRALSASSPRGTSSSAAPFTSGVVVPTISPPRGYTPITTSPIRPSVSGIGDLAVGSSLLARTPAPVQTQPVVQEVITETVTTPAGSTTVVEQIIETPAGTFASVEAVPSGRVSPTRSRSKARYGVMTANGMVEVAPGSAPIASSTGVSAPVFDQYTKTTVIQTPGFVEEIIQTESAPVAGVVPEVTQTPSGSVVVPTVVNLTSSPVVISNSLPFSGPNIEEELLNLGYVSSSRVVVSNGSPNSGNYVVAKTNRGDRVMILLDTNEKILIQPGDLTVVEQKDATVSPTSIQLGTLQLLNNNIDSAAFQCENGLCILSRPQGSAAPSQRSLIFSEAPSQRSVHLEGLPIAVPVVRLSQLRVDPQAISTAVAISSSDIRNKADNITLTEMTDFRNSFNANYELMQQYEAERSAQYQLLKSTMLAYEERVVAGLSNPALTDSDRINFEADQANLSIRKDLTEFDIGFNIRFASLRAQLDGINQAIVDLINERRAKFSTLGEVLVKTAE